MPALTRLYSPESFALQSLLVQVMGFAIVMLTLRYEFFVQLPSEDSDASSLIILVFVMGICGVIAITPLIWSFKYVIANLFGMATLTNWLVLIPGTAALVSASVALQNYAQRKGRYRLSSLSELGGKSAYIGTCLVGFWVFPDPAGLMLATAAGAIAKIFSLFVFFRRGINSKCCRPFCGKPLSIGTLMELLSVAGAYVRLSGSTVASHLLLSVTLIIPSAYIARAYGAENLGQFALAYSTIYLPTALIGNAIGQVYYQRAAERWAANRGFNDLWFATAKRLILVGFPIYASLFLMSSWVYPLIFGAQWTISGQLASIMSISAFFSFISSPLDRACLVVGAWRYVPLWHGTRAFSTGLIVMLSWLNSWSLKHFIIGLVVQTSIIYLIDYWAEFRFSLRRPVEVTR